MCRVDGSIALLGYPKRGQTCPPWKECWHEHFERCIRRSRRQHKRGPSKLLIETRNGVNEKYYYPDVPKLHGVGCCCDQICHDPEEKNAYFYARIPGSSKYCQLNPAAAVANEGQDDINRKGAAVRTGKIAGGSLLKRKNIKIHSVQVGKP